MNIKSYFTKKIETEKDFFEAYEELLSGEMPMILDGKNFNVTDYEEKTILENTSNKLKNNKDFALKIIKKESRFYNYLPEQLKNDPDIIDAKITYKSEYDYLGLEITKTINMTKEKAVELVKKSPSLYLDLTDELLNDKDVFKSAVEKDGMLICRYQTPQKFKDDKELVLTAINCEKYRFVNIIYEKLNDDLKNDRDIVLAAVKKSGGILHEVKDEYKDDEEIVFNAINCDKDVISELFSTRGRGDIFNEASDRLKNDRNFVLKVIKSQPEVIKNMETPLINDQEIAFEIYKIYYKEFINYDNEQDILKASNILIEKLCNTILNADSLNKDELLKIKEIVKELKELDQMKHTIKEDKTRKPWFAFEVPKLSDEELNKMTSERYGFEMVKTENGGRVRTIDQNSNKTEE